MPYIVCVCCGLRAYSRHLKGNKKQFLLLGAFERVRKWENARHARHSNHSNDTNLAYTIAVSDGPIGLWSAQGNVCFLDNKQKSINSAAKLCYSSPAKFCYSCTCVRRNMYGARKWRGFAAFIVEYFVFFLVLEARQIVDVVCKQIDRLGNWCILSYCPLLFMDFNRSS